MAHICPGWPGWPPRFLIERITETKEGNEDEMFPDGWDERNISVENENIWKNIPGEKLPKFVGKKWKHSIGRFQWQGTIGAVGGNDPPSELFFRGGEGFILFGILTESFWISFKFCIDFFLKFLGF